MAEVFKNLGQVEPAASTLTDLYTAPVQTVISTIKVCNASGLAQTFRLSHAIAGAADATAQYLHWDEPLPANLSFSLTEGITLEAGDVLRCFADGIGVAFNVYGSQVN
jgi:hypothetical protein